MIGLDIIMSGAALVWLAFVAGLMIWLALEVVERKLFFGPPDPEVKRGPTRLPLGESKSSHAKSLPREREISTEKRPLAQ